MAAGDVGIVPGNSMKKLLPPLKSLQAFEVAGRHESFFDAAEELSVTPGAVSRHVKILETFLGTALFERHSNGVVLTRAGSRYAAKTASLLGQLADATAEIRKVHERRRLVISTLPIFSERWLNHRFPQFQRNNRAIDFQFKFHDGKPTETAGEVDAWVYYSTRKHLKGDVTYLFGEELVPVCSPEFAKKLPTNATADQIARLPRLHDMFWDTDWQEWARAAGTSNLDFSSGMGFALYSGVIQAACSGIGVAMGHSAMIGDELADGRLVALTHLATRSARSYYLVIPELAAAKPIMRKLKDWFQSEAKNDERIRRDTP